MPYKRHQRPTDVLSTDREWYTEHGAHGEAVCAGIAGPSQDLVTAHSDDQQTSDGVRLSVVCARVYAPPIAGSHIDGAAENKYTFQIPGQGLSARKVVS